MKWTKEKPSKPGYYWQYDSEIDSVDLIEVKMQRDELWDMSPMKIGFIPHTIKDKGEEYFYFGPIEEPSKPNHSLD